MNDVDPADSYEYDGGALLALISDIISGEQTPTYEDIFQIADEYGCTVEEILGIRKYSENIEKPTTASDDGLTEKKRSLIESIKNLDDSDVDVVSAAADALIARREK